MLFSVSKSIEILERTPIVLSSLIEGLSSEWVMNNEGGDTWSVFDVLGHLLHGEKTDWMARTEIILSKNTQKHFASFDRLAQFETSKGKSTGQLLEEFRLTRSTNLSRLKSLQISEIDFEKIGLHPAFGEVKLSQLLATWAVHDLDHLAQIARIMAKQYKEETGPWIEYLKILRQ